MTVHSDRLIDINNLTLNDLQEIFKCNANGLVNHLIVKEDKIYLQNNPSNKWNNSLLHWISRVWHWMRVPNGNLKTIRDRIVEQHKSFDIAKLEGSDIAKCKSYFCTKIFLDYFDKRMIATHNCRRWSTVSPLVTENVPLKFTALVESISSIFNESTDYEKLKTDYQEYTSLLQFIKDVEVFTGDLTDTTASKTSIKAIQDSAATFQAYYEKREIEDEAEKLKTQLVKIAGFPYTFEEIVKNDFNAFVPLQLTRINKLEAGQEELEELHTNATSIAAIADATHTSSKKAFKDQQEIDKEILALRLMINPKLNVTTQENATKAIDACNKYLGARLTTQKMLSNPKFNNSRDLGECVNKLKQAQTVFSQFVATDRPIEVPLSEYELSYYEAICREYKEEAMKKLDDDATFKCPAFEHREAVQQYIDSHPQSKEKLEKELKEFDTLKEAFVLKSNLNKTVENSKANIPIVKQVISVLVQNETNVLCEYIIKHMDAIFEFTRSVFLCGVNELKATIMKDKTIDYNSPHLLEAANLQGLYLSFVDSLKTAKLKLIYEDRLVNFAKMIELLEPLSILFRIAQVKGKQEASKGDFERFTQTLPSNLDDIIFDIHRLQIDLTIAKYCTNSKDWPCLKDKTQYIRPKQKAIEDCHNSWLKKFELDKQAIIKSKEDLTGKSVEEFLRIYEDKWGLIVAYLHALFENERWMNNVMFRNLEEALTDICHELSNLTTLKLIECETVSLVDFSGLTTKLEELNQRMNKFKQEKQDSNIYQEKMSIKRFSYFEAFAKDIQRGLLKTLEKASPTIEPGTPPATD